MRRARKRLLTKRTLLYLADLMQTQLDNDGGLWEGLGDGRDDGDAQEEEAWITQITKSAAALLRRMAGA